MAGVFFGIWDADFWLLYIHNLFPQQFPLNEALNHVLLVFSVMVSLKKSYSFVKKYCLNLYTGCVLRSKQTLQLCLTKKLTSINQRDVQFLQKFQSRSNNKAVPWISKLWERNVFGKQQEGQLVVQVLTCLSLQSTQAFPEKISRFFFKKTAQINKAHKLSSSKLSCFLRCIKNSSKFSPKDFTSRLCTRYNQMRISFKIIQFFDWFKFKSQSSRFFQFLKQSRDLW